MFNRIELLHLADLPAERREPLLERLRRAAPAALLQTTLPGVYNGGDYLWKLRGAEPEAAEPVLPDPPPAERVVYRDGEGGGDWSRGGVYRALLLCLRPGTPAPAAERFERELLAMPRYIGSIRAWRLSRALRASGARRWSHVWEQRYDTLTGLTGTYMMHPYHWAQVDRWFDPESPDWIVDTHLCHSFCRFD